MHLVLRKLINAVVYLYDVFVLNCGLCFAFFHSNYTKQKNQSIYLFSDGITDQYGGDKGKKFSKARLKSFFQNNADFSLQTQRELLENTLNDWIGGREQVDDILVIGVEI